jgi:hypothetical protein
MTITSSPITSDDIFVLGNLGANAVVAGIGEKAHNILKFMQFERPENAGGFLMQAIFLYSEGYVKEAIDFIEESPVFEATKNRDEALAFHLVLLQADGQLDRALDLGHAYIGEKLIQSESAHHAVRKTLKEIEVVVDGHRLSVA